VKQLTAVALDAAFGHPRGVLGWVGGVTMARTNRAHEQRAAHLAEVTQGDKVLVLGPGPGVGLAEVAALVAPGGHVTAVEPSPVMRALSSRRCVAELARGDVDIRMGTAEDTGCLPQSFDAAIAVNNVMLWDLPLAFAELARVLKPSGRLVITVHRHVLTVAPEDIAHAARDAGLRHVNLTEEALRRSKARTVVMTAQR
jgi:arsenite methyltransferase